MKTITQNILAAGLALSLSASAFGVNYLTTDEKLAATTPASALAALKAGNQRFLHQDRRQYDFMKLAKVTAKKGQHPIAFILNCVDSRVDSHLVFDQGIGNIFTGSVAGNVVGPYMLASMEYATKAVGSKLIVIMGHTHCGAVGAACVGKGFGNITQLIQRIEPAVATLKAKNPAGTCIEAKFVDQIAKQNVLDMIQLTLQQSPVIAQLQKDNAVQIVGAMQDIATGTVTFFDADGKAL